MCTNQPLRMMELGVYGANAFPMLFTWWNSHSPKYFVAHVNGHCEGTCKHQIVVILTCIDISQEEIIHCYGTWYGSHCGGLGHMFADPRHILNDMESNDDDQDEHLEGDEGIMEFDGLMNMEQSVFPMGAIVRFNDTINSLTPMERAFAQLVTTMQEITNECKEGDVTLCEHVTSHMRVLTCNIRDICFTKANVVSLKIGVTLHRRWIGK